MQLVCKSGEIGVQLQCFWNTIAMVLGRKRLFIEKQGDDTKKRKQGIKASLNYLYGAFIE